MQDFKIGDKVLIEAEITGKYLNEPRYKIETDKTMYGASAWINGEDIYPADIATRTHEDGMAEAWELARRIVYYDSSVRKSGFTDEQLEEIFGTDSETEILQNYTATEAAAKIKAWEDAKEINVGDVVKMTEGEFEGVVSKVKGSGCYVIFGDGSSGRFRKDDLIKTGRKIDIAGLLAEIGWAERT